METLEEVWAGDLFDRRREAVDLIGYLESVAGRSAIREDSHAHVMAIDTAYGHGKTFFLRRLDRHLKATEHVSAYVDAWVDDLEDEPMVALAATLDQALQPWIAKSPAIATGLTNFKSKAGTVAKLVGIGLAKRGAGFLITQGVAEAVSDELARASETGREIATDALKDGGKAAVDEVAAALEPITPSMELRIKRFRDGQDAIEAMKRSLAEVVEALKAAGMSPPITIIVDELDRCRPTYAVKVLEEIKHLFDVKGVAFLLGLHGKQLECSVSAAYGQRFDAAAYLRRFFNRSYSLRPVSLKPLVRHLIKSLEIEEKFLVHPSVFLRDSNRPVDLPAAELIADYLRAYDIAARDVFSIMEALHTATALVGAKHVQLIYLLPLIISRHLGADALLRPSQELRWEPAFSTDPFGRDPRAYPFGDFIEKLHETAQLSDQRLANLSNAHNLHARIVLEGGFRNSSDEYHLLQNYTHLVRVVARFS